MSDHTDRPRSPEHEHRGRAIRAEIRTTATPEQAWQAWSDPARIRQWFADDARGAASPGEQLVLTFRKFALEFPYDVLAAEPGRRLLLRGVAPGGAAFLLEVTIQREGGDTVVRLINSGFADPSGWDEEYQGVLSGWQMALGILKYYLENHFGKAKDGFIAMHPARVDYDIIREWFTREDRLREWFGEGDISPIPGAPARIELSGDGILEGHTLAATRSEIAVSWDARRLALELKAFAAGPQQSMIALRATGWGSDPQWLRELEGWAEAALQRLADRLA